MAERAYKKPSKKVAEKIQKVFEDYSLNDDDVALELNMERRTIFNYRHGVTNPRVEFLQYLCEEYNINANWLLCVERSKL